ncbi:probable proteasome inhibitor [Henckelia pumila]|uniref:probable proteasome inhibitor n=1 Tax=Henckelia pumila TaxID=405737 RepID=UPI003C6DDA65
MATEKTVMLVIRAARPEFLNNQDKAAFAVHAAFMAAGYTLHSTGLPAFESRILDSCSVTDEVGWEKWNELLDYYGFLYSHPKQAAGSKRVLMKILVIKKKMYVDVLKQGDSEQPHHLEFDILEYVEEVCSEYTNNYASQFKNLSELVAHVNTELLSKLDGSSTNSSNPRPDQCTPSTRTEVNLSGALQIQLTGPCFPPLPPLILHAHLHNPQPFGDGPEPGHGFMPNYIGAYI